MHTESSSLGLLLYSRLAHDALGAKRAALLLLDVDEDDPSLYSLR